MSNKKYVLSWGNKYRTGNIKHITVSRTNWISACKFILLEINWNYPVNQNWFGYKHELYVEWLLCYAFIYTITTQI